MKEYKILVLALSTLPNPLDDSRSPFNNIYLYQPPKKEEAEAPIIEENLPPSRVYHGIGQLEPVPQYLLDNEGTITHYIILATSAVKKPHPLDWAEVQQQICARGLEGKIDYAPGEQLSDLDFFERRIEAFHRERGLEKPAFEIVDLVQNDPGPGLEVLLQKVRALYKECMRSNPGAEPEQCWRLFLDIHGSLREAAFATFTLIQILSAPDMDDEEDLKRKHSESPEQYISRLTDGKPTIPVSKIFTVNYDNADRSRSYIVDTTRLYQVYARESIKSYMNYGQYAQMALRSRIDPFDPQVKPYAFISYRRADAPKERFTFIGSLKKAGFRYWYDDAIPVLQNWADTLRKANEKCTLFIALITKGYYSSFQCMKELAQAIAEEKTIFLFSLDQTALYNPETHGADQLTVKNSDTDETVSIAAADIEAIIQKQQLALKDLVRDGVYQPSAFVDSLNANPLFQSLKA